METPETTTSPSTEHPRGRLMDQNDIDAFVAKITLTKAKGQGKVSIDLTAKELNILTCVLQAFGILHAQNQYLQTSTEEDRRMLDDTIDKLFDLTCRVDAHEKSLAKISDNVASHEIRVQFNNRRIEKLEQKLEQKFESQTTKSQASEPHKPTTTESAPSSKDIKTYVTSAKAAVDKSHEALQIIEAERILTRDQLDRMRIERDAARNERDEIRREVQDMREETAAASKCMNGMLNTLNKLRTTVEYMQKEIAEAGGPN